MTATKTELIQRLLTPGPTAVPAAVLREMALPIIHHRTKAFEAVFAEVGQRLARVMKTAGPVLSIAGSGTTAFEAAQVSLARPGSKVMAVAGGKFGERWQDIFDQYAPALNLKPVKLDVPWGEAVSPEALEAFLGEHGDVDLIALVHSETSTATACDLKAIVEVVRRKAPEALLIVDGITSVGAMPVDMDGWGIDVLVTGSQKALMLPPGLGFVGLGPRALDRLKQFKAGPSYNLDLRRWLKSHAQNTVPFTPPVSLIRGQRVALEMIESEGLEQVWARTRMLADASRAAMDALGLTLCSKSPSDSVTGIFYPQGADDKKFRNRMRDEFGIHLAGGQDGRGASWSGKIFRISHMGFVTIEDTVAAIEAAETVLREMCPDLPGKPGDAVAAARAILDRA
ncbi:MAG: alanine--glyoxylate aminotransferase family protein [Phycisphaeraceae bacterium]|nr:alanine--glyoxylate aminotransferase family protein [Phycisphaeraceae bacterium]